MGYPTRTYYTEADKSSMWDRRQKGDSLNPDRPPFWLQSFIDTDYSAAVWWHTLAEAKALKMVADPGRA